MNNTHPAQYEKEFIYILVETSMGTKLENPNNMPKCLLPVGGKPILQWQLEVLEKMKIPEVYLLIGKSVETIFQKELSNFGLKTITCKIYPINDFNSLQSAPALMEFKEDMIDEIKKYRDLILIGSDLLFDIPTFTAFVNYHRSTSSYLTIMASEEKKQKPKKGKEVSEPAYKDYILMNKKNMVLNLIYGNGSESFSFGNLLYFYPELIVQNELQTLRTFIVRTNIFLIHQIQESDCSLHKEVLPSLLKTLRTDEGTELYTKYSDDPYNHIQRSALAPSFLYVKQSNLTFRITKEEDRKKVKALVKNNQFALY